MKISSCLTPEVLCACRTSGFAILIVCLRGNAAADCLDNGCVPSLGLWAYVQPVWIHTCRALMYRPCVFIIISSVYVSVRTPCVSMVIMCIRTQCVSVCVFSYSVCIHVQRVFISSVFIHIQCVFIFSVFIHVQCVFIFSVFIHMHRVHSVYYVHV